MKEQTTVDNDFLRSSSTFDEDKHNLLYSKLKQLYIAIIRMRQRLCICENQKEFSKPMFNYWKKLCLAQVRSIDCALAEEMQVRSTLVEWKKRGGF